MLFLFQLLAVVGCAAFAGVMLAIALILGPYWRALAPADFLVWFAAHSGTIARVIPLVVGPSVLGLVGAVVLSWSDAGARNLWLAALVGVGVVLALTAAYFLPLNARFSGGAMPVGEVSQRLDAWLALHWVRVALGFAAAALGVAALRA